MEQKDIRYQNILLTIPSGTTVNQLLENNVQLDRAYQRITGIQVSVIDSTVIGNELLVGARTQRKTWVDLIPISAWNAETGVAPDQKFMDINIPYGSGDTFYLNAQNLAVPGSNVELYMTLRLENTLVEIPK